MGVVFVKLLANSANPDQTAPMEQSDLGLYLFAEAKFPIFHVNKE